MKAQTPINLTLKDKIVKKKKHRLEKKTNKNLIRKRKKLESTFQTRNPGHKLEIISLKIN
jgi:hypothetical protein